MRLTVAGDTSTSAAICLPVWRCRRNVSTALHVVGGVWLGDEWGSGRAIMQPLHTFCAEPLDPFGDGLRRRVELVGRVGLAQPTLDHASHHRLSTFGRQRRILVDVHLVSPWNTEASQPQLPRFRPDGQPPERPQLGAAPADDANSKSPCGGFFCWGDGSARRDIDRTANCFLTAQRTK